MSSIPAIGMSMPSCQAKRQSQESDKQNRHATPGKRIPPGHAKRLAASQDQEQQQEGVRRKHRCDKPEGNTANSAAKKEIDNAQKRHRHLGPRRNGVAMQAAPEQFNPAPTFNQPATQALGATSAFGGTPASGLGQLGSVERSALALLNNIQTQSLQPLFNSGGSTVSLAAPILDSVFGINGAASNPFAGFNNPFAGGFNSLMGSPITQPLAIGGLGGGFFA